LLISSNFNLKKVFSCLLLLLIIICELRTHRTVTVHTVQYSTVSGRMTTRFFVDQQTCRRTSVHPSHPNDPSAPLFPKNTKEDSNPPLPSPPLVLRPPNPLLHIMPKEKEKQHKQQTTYHHDEKTINATITPPKPKQTTFPS